ncbi:carboxymuconolactone decarboxylase family protein [Polynucleobacter necessarius]|uniref:carboxymuconolactone decarboxylase family protein n=1 Tax=Polynucleobacter necessarius TaxID=576610 RepID=UPI000E096EDA|nr:carboxymuconolactone decarboxylase family protein [Polynucleobacter necessarius]
MPQIHPLTIEQADAESAQKLSAVKAKIGMVLNVVGTLANSPAALNLYLTSSQALSAGRLTPRQREIIALTIGQLNQCHYCLSAHTMIGKGAGLSPEEIADARAGKASDPVENAIAEVASKLVTKRGFLTAEDIAQAKAAGLDDGLIVEIIANLVHNTLTNYTNHAAQTEIDFPVVPLEI